MMLKHRHTARGLLQGSLYFRAKQLLEVDLNCQKNLFGMTRHIFREQKFIEVVRALQGCPWKEDKKVRDLLNPFTLWLEKEDPLFETRSQFEHFHPPPPPLVLNRCTSQTHRSLLQARCFGLAARALQRCSLTPTSTSTSRAEFQKCCNASYSAFVTQENTPIGRTIHFDGHEGKKKVTESLHSLFPKNSPFQKPFKSCAVVGNGGILNNSFCGAEIDHADFVFRMNLPPMNWTNDVGTKTNAVTANPSILIDKFSSLLDKRKPFTTLMKEYGTTLIILPAFSYLQNTDVSLRVLYTMEDFDLDSRVVFFNPDYLRNLTAYWKQMGIKFKRLSSGLMVVSAAIEVCDKVTLYGFWPFSQGLDGVPILHHYYDNSLPIPGVHSMPEEFYQYLQMHIRGLLRLNLEQC
ncbi:PREDICTED: alpha-N-acetylneuraminide alpha-2,8-sialyltransferase-like [Nanorana parkeri]|uniref:alpha-N-acetylneuraminide alpha-2,8-sialyltransferase-like n=1 Tax=Nanorana parkeri TaxID=125878 RepID=UPI000854A232|nr:PREDICTED: alpha-N-acetylneuraminide alpha-2,8-sialyltransferase-like [Nanorana parkeri]